MALECYASAADYQALYGTDGLTGTDLDNALWQASRGCGPADPGPH